MLVTEDVEILLVEDNSTDAELAIQALKERNLDRKLVWVKDGAEALEFIFATGTYSGRRAENLPRVVMLDLRLPYVDGLEVLRRLKAEEATRKVPVVAITASMAERDMLASYNFGVNSYICKPTNFDDFAEMIADAGYYWLRINRLPRKLS